MALSVGAVLGRYQVLGPLGAGGMGEVYRARDPHLERNVAIKILPESFVTDHDRLARFDREAKALASLNHPHIAQVFGVEDLAARGGAHLRALVMELVEGADLSVRIARGPMPVVEALPIAQQLADALESAHERGIIHRDLKPANIKLTPDGIVKVLDFGLAKAMSRADPDSYPSDSSTIASSETQAGRILGTVGYMAPEQARGQPVDRRVDVWAFGVVLFEMLAGKRPFAGETSSDVLAAVLTNDLDWSLLPRAVPRPIVTLLRRCLNPDRRNRLRDMGEARIAIADHLAGKLSEDTAASTATDRRRIRLLGAAALLASLAAVAAIGFVKMKRDAPEVSRRLVVVPPGGVSVQTADRPSVALSPDGWTVVFTGVANGVSHLYMRAPGDFEPRLLPGTQAASSPVFSPSGNSLVFVADNRLMVTSMGGSARALATVNGPRGIAWVDESTVVYTAGSGDGLTELGINGGSPRELTTVDVAAGERTHRWPSAVPGSRWVLFTVGTNNSPDNYEAARIDAVDRQTGERRTVFTGASSARVASSGHLLLVRESSLLAVGFDHGSLRMSGEPVSVLQDVGGDRTSGAAHVALSAGGTLAYLPADDGAGSRRLVWSDLDGVVQAIDLPPAVYNDVRLSPDGTRLVYTLGPSGAGEVWVYSFVRGTTTRLTFTGINATPIWSADGRNIIFAAADGARTLVLETNAEGGSEPVAIAAAEGRAELRQVSADGTWALIDLIGGGQGGRPHIARLPLRGGGTAEAIAGTRDAYGGALSPDGRLLAYQFVEGSRSEIYVRELTASGGRWQVSTAGGEEPAWSRDGATLFYRTDGKMMQVSVDRTTRFATRPPRLMFDGSFNLRSDSGISYHPSPDGKRLVMIRRAESQSSGGVRVITNWLSELSGIK